MSDNGEPKTPWIDTKYLVASGFVAALLCVTIVASHQGWGLSNEAQALQKARNNAGGSVRSGSVHGRRYFGGGSSFGK